MNKIFVGFIFVAVIGTLTGCSYTPEFSEYHGPSVTRGQGGTSRMIRGMEVWDGGTPPRTYQILGTMTSIGGNHSDTNFELEQIVKAAKTKGADALIVMRADTDFTGVNLHSGSFARSPRVQAMLIKY